MSSAAGGRITAGVGSNLIGQHAQDRNQEATVYAGNLDPQVTEELIWELFTQAGPVANVYLPKDRVTNNHQGYGFVEFKGEEDCDYAIKILNMIKMFGKPIRVNKASSDRKTLDVGANLFIGNLDPDVDEKLLYDTFSAFGVIINTPKLMRDPETGNSRGFGFVSYDCFEAADACIEAMGGQYLCNRAITVSFAFKKDTKAERHGTPAERLLAAQQAVRQAQQSRPHTLFASGPKQQPQPGQQDPYPHSYNPPSSSSNAGAPLPAPVQNMAPPPPQQQQQQPPMLPPPQQQQQQQQYYPPLQQQQQQQFMPTPPQQQQQQQKPMEPPQMQGYNGQQPPQSYPSLQQQQQQQQPPRFLGGPPPPGWPGPPPPGMQMPPPPQPSSMGPPQGQYQNMPPPPFQGGMGNMPPPPGSFPPPNRMPPQLPAATRHAPAPGHDAAAPDDATPSRVHADATATGVHADATAATAAAAAEPPAMTRAAGAVTRGRSRAAAMTAAAA
ncbi:MAG: hypothetical protein WDW38_005970 [Sanguina aurantia]